MPPFPGDIADPEKSGLFLYLNSNKRGITLDVATESGRRVFTDLVRSADILTEDRPVGELEQLGLGYDSLNEINPGLIVASITPYGRTGPYRDYKAQPLNVCHASGQGYLLPLPAHDADRPPVKTGGHMPDYDAGLVSVLPVLAALFSKGVTGKGQFIEISRQEALISMQRVESVTFANDGVVITRGVSRKGGMPGGIMQCADGYVVVITPQQHQWEALVALVGDPAWAEEEMCRDALSRAENVETINLQLGEWMQRHTREEIFHRGQALNCPVAPVYSAEDMAKSEQYQAREFFVEVEHPEIGKLLVPSCAHHFAETPWAYRRPAPALGEHNEEVLCEELNYTVEDLVRLREAGAV
jgi:crotonobetainyl-CoA:carnitine CoA-transferase CaiB-like acyl-CoA transferase